MKHFISLLDLLTEEVAEILELASMLKQKLQAGKREPVAVGRVITQVFEKPSLRTRVSFEAAIAHLGGASIFLSGKEAGLEGRETLEDVSRVLGGYSDVIILRTFSHQLIESVAQFSGRPVVNALSDECHPTQALADLLTIQECLGETKEKHLVYVGDGNNVANSLAVACGHVGAQFTIAAPDGYRMSDSIVKQITTKFPNLNFTQTNDPQAAVAKADVIYTDVWASMGQEAEKAQRAIDFADFQVNSNLLDIAGDDVMFLHCLPARRGLEVTDEVMEDPRSKVFQQAENRMHLAKGLLVWLLKHAED